MDCESLYVFIIIYYDKCRTTSENQTYYNSNGQLNSLSNLHKNLIYINSIFIYLLKLLSLKLHKPKN